MEQVAAGLDAGSVDPSRDRANSFSRKVPRK
jgi:hypothetical protein